MLVQKPIGLRRASTEELWHPSLSYGDAWLLGSFCPLSVRVEARRKAGFVFSAEKSCLVRSFTAGACSFVENTF